MSRTTKGGRAETSELPLHTISCKHLILSAGTLGTTRLMLRNGHALPGLAKSQLGLGFSGNGDLLTFAFHCSQRGPDGKKEPLVIDAARGPVITSAIRMPDALDSGGGVPPEQKRGFYLEDAGYPQVASWTLEALEAPETLDRGDPSVRALAVSRSAPPPQRDRCGHARACSATASCPRRCCRCWEWVETCRAAR